MYVRCLSCLYLVLFWRLYIVLSNPDRIVVSLPMYRSEERNGDKNERSAITTDRKSSIVEYLESNGTCSAREMADYVGLKASRPRDYLGELVEDWIVVAEGSNKNRRYLSSDP